MAASMELWMVTTEEREQVEDGVLALLFSHILGGYTQTCNAYQHHSINYTHMSVTMGPFHSSLAALHAYSVMPRRVALLRYIFLLFYCLPSQSFPRSLTRLFSDHVAITL